MLQRDRKKEKKEIEEEDIYDDEQREEMLRDDEITEAEYAFMEGREKKKKNLGLRSDEHEDTASTHLAEDEYLDD